MKKIILPLLLAALCAACNGKKDGQAGNGSTAVPGNTAGTSVTPLAIPAEIVKSDPPAPGVVATVYGHRITEAQVREGIAQYKKGVKSMMNQDVPAEKAKDLYALVLDQLINVKAVLAEAERLGITVPATELEARLVQMEQNPAFTAMLKEMKLDRDGIKAKLRDETVVMKFMETRFERNTEVTAGEIKDFYNEHREKFVQPVKVRASHIYVKDDKAKLEELRLQLQQGSSFADLAKKHSEDKSTAAKGGDLGFFAKGDLLPEFDRTAFVMPRGQVSPVIKTKIGYHLLTVTGKQGDAPVSMAAAEPDIKKLLVMQKNNKRLEDLIRDIRRKSDIKIFN